MAASNSVLMPVKAKGWGRGFNNLFAAELSSWWRTRRWWVQSLVWLAIVNGILALTIWTEGSTPDPSLFDEGLELFTIFQGVFVTIGAVIVMQGVIIGEKNAGTAEWVMSKPITRSAYIMAKLFSNVIGFTMIGVVLQSVVAYVQLWLASGIVIDPGRFTLGIAVLVLNVLFFLTLTLLMGTLFNNRLPVLGIPLGLLFFQQWIIGLAPDVLVHIFPISLALPITDSSAALELINGVPVSLPIPLISTAVWVLIFTGLAVWRFSREEF